MKMSKETIWQNLNKNKYPKVKTPRMLMIHLRDGDKEGKFLHNGFYIDFKVVREDESAWVVASEKISRSGGSSGGHYYVSKKNPARAVWD